MSATTISIDTSDRATPALRAVYAAVGAGNRRAFTSHIADRTLQRIKDHFRERGQGGPQGSFWASVEDATQITNITDADATISIASEGFALRLLGGYVEVQSTGILTAENVPTFAPEKPLRQLASSSGPRIAVSKRSSQGTRTLRALYSTVHAVAVAPDPSALPSEAELAKSIDRAGEQYLERILIQGGSL